MLAQLLTAAGLSEQMLQALTKEDTELYTQLESKREDLLTAIEQAIDNVREEEAPVVREQLEKISALNDEIELKAKGLKEELYADIRNSNRSKKANAAYKS